MRKHTLALVKFWVYRSGGVFGITSQEVDIIIAGKLIDTSHRSPAELCGAVKPNPDYKLYDLIRQKKSALLAVVARLIELGADRGWAIKVIGDLVAPVLFVDRSEYATMKARFDGGPSNVVYVNTDEDNTLSKKSCMSLEKKIKESLPPKKSKQS